MALGNGGWGPHGCILISREATSFGMSAVQPPCPPLLLLSWAHPHCHTGSLTRPHTCTGCWHRGATLRGGAQRSLAWPACKSGRVSGGWRMEDGGGLRTVLAYQLWPGGRRKDKVEAKESGREGPTLRSERRGWLKGEKERCCFKAGHAKRRLRLEAGGLV